MSRLVERITDEGAVLSLEICPSFPRMEMLKKLGQKIPDPFPARMLIDTGSTCTLVDSRIIKVLQLAPTGESPVHTISTGARPLSSFRYDISLVVPGPHRHPLVKALPAVEADLSVHYVDGLIGLDVLRRCLLVFDARGEQKVTLLYDAPA